MISEESADARYRRYRDQAGKFNTLVKAVQMAELVEALKGTGPFTVFAPTDEAFSALPSEVVQNLLNDKQKLTEILKYHVVSGRYPASEVGRMPTASTLQGGQVRFDTSRGVKVNEANVVNPDVMCSNGIIHVIDRVLIPSGVSVR